ncbi:6-phosphogluconolactonase [compost metagenome]
MTRLEVVQDPAALATAAAERVAAIAEAAVAERGRFTLALSGGSTPRALFETLAAPPWRDRLPWARFEVAWVDERDVPIDHPDSNAGMAYRAWLEHVPIPRDQIHPVPTRPGPPAAAARAYETTLRGLFPDEPWPRFDLALLGVGEDGHTASLFPGSPALDEAASWVVAPWVPHLDAYRFSLSLPAIAHARRLIGLVAGETKAPVMREVLEGLSGAPLPARRVAEAHGHAEWLLDAAAASALSGLE